jgi:FAD binding domain/Berberine and berberine like
VRRRAFCTAGLAALAGAALPYRRVVAAPGGSDIAAVGLNGRQLTLKAADINDLHAGLRGELLSMGDPGYDGARRVWNGAFDRKPALVARCVGAADVVRAVGFASGNGILTAVRGGGHSLSGQSVCEGGFVIDLSAMRSVHIDPLKKLARLEPGTLIGQFDSEAQAFGLATTAGIAADTGMAGLTLGGGLGRLGPKFGLTIDNLMGAEVLTADGRFVKASADVNPDLLWGLRGGGGNFGVVTSFEYRLHAVGPMLFGGHLIYPFAGARRLMRSFADFAAAAPDELYVLTNFDATDEGTRQVKFNVCYCGPPGQAERVVAPLRQLGKPLEDRLAPASYLDLQRARDALKPYPPYGYYIKGGLIRSPAPALIDVVIDYIESAPLESGSIVLQPAGGAASRVPPQATAYWNRQCTYNIQAIGAWEVPGDGAQRNTEWVRGAWAKLEPFTQGYYVNLGETDQEAHEHRVRSAYGDNYPRLAALKRRYDPTNLFRLNANIKPAA